MQVCGSTQHCPLSTALHTSAANADSTQTTPPSTAATAYQISASPAAVTSIDAALELATLNHQFSISPPHAKECPF